MQQYVARIHVLEDEMKSTGAWVFGGALHGPDTATVVRVSNDEVLTTDGPFAESREHRGPHHKDHLVASGSTLNFGPDCLGSGINHRAGWSDRKF